GDQRLEARLVGQEMQVRRAHIVPALRAQKFPYRAVNRDRIAGGLDAAETDAAVRVGEEFAAQVHVGLQRVLVLVKTLRRGVPDIDLGAFNRLAVGLAERGLDKQSGARCRRSENRAAILHPWRIHAPEWTKLT